MQQQVMRHIDMGTVLLLRYLHNISSCSADKYFVALNCNTNYYAADKYFVTLNCNTSYCAAFLAVL